MRRSTRLTRLALTLTVSTALTVAVFTGTSAAVQASTGMARPAADSPGLAAAKRQLQALNVPSPLIKVRVPLTKKPPRGKKVFFISNGSATGIRTFNGLNGACATLGWTCQALSFTTNPADTNGLILQALQQGASYIAYQGVNASLISQALGQARAANVPVFQTNDVYPAEGTKNWIFSQVAGPEAYINGGKYLADWAIVNTPGNKPSTLVVTVPTITVFKVFGDAVVAEYKKNCPGCAIDTLSMPFADVQAGKLGPAIVNYVRSHPEINNIIFCTSQFVGSTPTQLRNAGFTVAGANANGIRLTGQGVSDADLKAIARGDQAAGLGSPAEYNGWVIADAMARVSVNNNLTPNWKATMPWRLFTTANTTTSTNLYAGPPNYTGQFKKLWRISS